MMKEMSKVRFASLILISIVIVVMLSTLIPVGVINESELENLGFGIPFKFIYQNQSSLDPPLPIRLNFGSPWEHPIVSFSVGYFILSAGVVLLILSLVSAVIRKYIKKG